MMVTLQPMQVVLRQNLQQVKVVILKLAVLQHILYVNEVHRATFHQLLITLHQHSEILSVQRPMEHDTSGLDIRIWIKHMIQICGIIINFMLTGPDELDHRIAVSQVGIQHIGYI